MTSTLVNKRGWKRTNEHRLDSLICARSACVRAPLEQARLAVLVSGEGSNIRALVQAREDPAFGTTVVLVGANRECSVIDWRRNEASRTLFARFLTLKRAKTGTLSFDGTLNKRGRPRR